MNVVPFGYRKVEDNDEPVQPDPIRSKALVRIFKLFVTGKYTFKSLADKLAKRNQKEDRP